MRWEVTLTSDLKGRYGTAMLEAGSIAVKTETSTDRFRRDPKGFEALV